MELLDYAKLSRTNLRDLTSWLIYIRTKADVFVPKKNGQSPNERQLSNRRKKLEPFADAVIINFLTSLSNSETRMPTIQDARQHLNNAVIGQVPENQRIIDNRNPYHPVSDEHEKLVYSKAKNRTRNQWLEAIGLENGQPYKPTTIFTKRDQAIRKQIEGRNYAPDTDWGDGYLAPTVDKPKS